MKTPHRKAEMRTTKPVVFAAVAAGLASAASAALYTNTWSTAEGLSTTWNWGDAANWSVAYGADTPAPASNVPTSDSVTYLNKTANITLQSGDDWHLGETYFLGTVWDRTLNVTIPAGAKLSLDGTGMTSRFGYSRWRDASENNKMTIDVNGGGLVLGQKELRISPNEKGAMNNPSLNHIVIRNGGTVSLTNGCLHVYGGRTAASGTGIGSGNFTNVIDVLADSTLKIAQSGRLQFGDSTVRTEHGLTQNYSGGYLYVRGGKVDCTECENEVAIGVAGGTTASCGTYVTVSDGGEMDFGGKQMSINTANTNILRVTSGGSVKQLGDFHVRNGGYDKVSYHNMIDVDGGSVELDHYQPGKATGNSGGRTTFRIHGWTGRSSLAIGGLGAYLSWYYEGSGTAPYFLDCRLAPHTPCDVRFPIAPLAFTHGKDAIIAGSNNGDVTSIHGINRISPDGGFQLVHKKKFEMVVRPWDGSASFTYANSYRFIGDDMWTNTVGSITGSDVSVLVGAQTGYAYFAELKDDAKLVDGQPLVTPRPRAWLPLPEFSARQLTPVKTKRISVRLDIVAPESGTLDLDRVLKNMRENGWPEASTDESVAGYNVRVDLPLDELQANTQTDSVVMDFVEVNDYQQANGLVPFTTNALIRAATCETIPIIRGMEIKFR